MSEINTSESSILRLLLGIAATILILAGMWAGKSIINLILFAGQLTLLSIPLLNWLKKKGLSTSGPNIMPNVATYLSNRMCAAAMTPRANTPGFEMTHRATVRTAMTQ